MDHIRAVLGTSPLTFIIFKEKNQYAEETSTLWCLLLHYLQINAALFPRNMCPYAVTAPPGYMSLIHVPQVS